MNNVNAVITFVLPKLYLRLTARETYSGPGQMIRDKAWTVLSPDSPILHVKTRTKFIFYSVHNPRLVPNHLAPNIAAEDREK